MFETFPHVPRQSLWGATSAEGTCYIAPEKNGRNGRRKRAPLFRSRWILWLVKHLVDRSVGRSVRRRSEADLRQGLAQIWLRSGSDLSQI